ncbi:MAG: Crp/Fnr family transcriptional regulator [Acinetobacter sp.]
MKKPNHLSQTTSKLNYYTQVHTSNSSHYLEEAKKLLLSYNFIQQCTEEEISYLFKNLKIKRFMKGEIVQRKDEPVNNLFIILSGTIEGTSYTENDKQITHTFFPSGILLNIASLMNKSPSIIDYISFTPSIIAYIPEPIIQHIVKNNHNALMAIFKLMCQRFNILSTNIYYDRTKDLRTRLASRLIYIIQSYNFKKDSGITINIKLSQEHLAKLLNTTRQRINQEMKWMAENGIAEARYQQINILNLELLKKIAEHNDAFYPFTHYR